MVYFYSLIFFRILALENIAKILTTEINNGQLWYIFIFLFFRILALENITKILTTEINNGQPIPLMWYIFILLFFRILALENIAKILTTGPRLASPTLSNNSFGRCMTSPYRRACRQTNLHGEEKGDFPYESSLGRFVRKVPFILSIFLFKYSLLFFQGYFCGYMPLFKLVRMHLCNTGERSVVFDYSFVEYEYTVYNSVLSKQYHRI